MFATKAACKLSPSIAATSKGCLLDAFKYRMLATKLFESGFAETENPWSHRAAALARAEDKLLVAKLRLSGRAAFSGAGKHSTQVNLSGNLVLPKMNFDVKRNRKNSKY